MAINPEAQYPGKITPGDANYPYGSARNVTVPGDGTGTPWEAALLNDIFGFQQAMLNEAAIVPSGAPDNVLASQYLSALKAVSQIAAGQQFNNVTLLQANTKKIFLATVNGSGSAGDGGGRVYFYDTSDTGSADDGAFDIVDSRTPRAGTWKPLSHRIDSTLYQVPFAPSDGSVLLQKAIDKALALGNEFVDLKPGKYLASGLTGTDSVKFRGKGAVFSDLSLRVLGETAQRFNLPVGFSDMPFSEYTVDAIGTASVDIDVEQLWADNETQGTVPYHVSWVNGNDANNGSTNNPLKTINAAAQKADVGVILLMDGIHYDGLDAFVPTRDIEIRSFSGDEQVIRMGEDPADYTFTVTPATSFEYEAVISRQIRAVFDNTLPDGKGGYKEMTLVADAATVNATPGSWYYDVGLTKLFVRMFTNRAPGTDLVMLTTSQNILAGDQAMFLKNVKIEGGEHGFQLNATAAGSLIPRLYMQDCRIFYSNNFGIDSNAGKTYLERVEVADSKSDNLNYHDLDGTACVALEIDITSRGAGIRSQLAENNNASSMHENGVVVRVNGDYYDSYGPTLPDTDGSFSLNIGVVARDSQAPTAGFNVNFLNGQNLGGGKMFCHHCLSKGAATDYSATVSEIFVAECSDQGVFFEASAAAHVEQYWPDDKV